MNPKRKHHARTEREKQLRIKVRKANSPLVKRVQRHADRRRKAEWAFQFSRVSFSFNPESE